MLMLEPRPPPQRFPGGVPVLRRCQRPPRKGPWLRALRGSDPSRAAPELKQTCLFLPQPFRALEDVGVSGEPEVLGVR